MKKMVGTSQPGDAERDQMTDLHPSTGQSLVMSSTSNDENNTRTDYQPRRVALEETDLRALIGQGRPFCLPAVKKNDGNCHPGR